MSFLLVPHQVSDTAATIWVGALDEENVSQRPVRLELEGGNEGHAIELDASAWETWESFRPEDSKSYPLVGSLVAPGLCAQGPAGQKNPRLPARGGETSESADHLLSEAARRRREGNRVGETPEGRARHHVASGASRERRKTVHAADGFLFLRARGSRGAGRRDLPLHARRPAPGREGPVRRSGLSGQPVA
jgi:hypothetical protein